jgi:hypothetical protein
MAKKAKVWSGTDWVDLAAATTDLSGYPALATNQFGFRNKIINGDFRINQRGYTSGSNLASGAYGFDRWKSNYTNTTLTFTSAPQGQTVTINVGGSVRQIIERANMPAGTYVLSWTGTAIGSVFNSGATAPVGVLSPLVVTLDGSADVVVEFGPAGAGTATLGNVQLEAGSVPSAFEYRPIGTELELCKRYYQAFTGNATGTTVAVGNSDSAGTAGGFSRGISPTMRVAPTNGFTGTVYVTDFIVYRPLSALTSDRNTPDTFSTNPSYTGGTLNATRPAFIYITGGAITLSAEL